MDPLSVAAGCAGLLSLGIDVCNGLLDYYTSWKDGKEDVERMYLSIQELTKTLKLIRSAIDHKEFNRNVVVRVEESINSTKVGIESLKKKLDKIKISAQQDGW